MRTAYFVPFLLCVAAATVPAQGASVQFFGTGCSYAGQPLSIGAAGLPQIGATFALTYTGPNFNSTLTIHPAIALGLGTTSVPIPVTLLPQQPPGCTQWITADVIQFMPATATGMFATQLDVPLPNTPSLIGFTFAAQWFATVVQCGIVLPCTFDALPTSDAALLTIGL